jgi:hypothetical protein
VSRRALWFGALKQGSVWKRALKMGLTVGLLQAAINQGEFWWKGEVRGGVLAKTILSPLVGFALVLLSTAATWVEQNRGGKRGN